MSNVAIVTDSLADIPRPLMEELAITAVPTLVRFGDTVFRDRVDLSTAEFYRRLTASTTLPSTSQPPPSDFEQVFNSLEREHDQILAITTTAKLSGIYNSAVVAAQNVPGAHIQVLDSQQVTMALGWLVVLAARAALQGASMQEIKGQVEDAIPRSHVLAMLDTVEYVRRGGRLGKASAILVTLLNVKPLIALAQGEVVPVEKVRTQRKALERLTEIVLASGPIQNLAVMHAAGLPLAEQLRAKFVERIDHEQDILMGETGPVLGTHVGPGAVGVAWVNAK